MKLIYKNKYDPPYLQLRISMKQFEKLRRQSFDIRDFWIELTKEVFGIHLDIRGGK
jgi:hypothetical protein